MYDHVGHLGEAPPHFCAPYRKLEYGLGAVKQLLDEKLIERALVHENLHRLNLPRGSVG